MEFKGNLTASDLINRGGPAGMPRFRLVVARAKPLLRVITPAFLEGNMGDAYDALAKSGYTITISPRPVETSQTAAIDVRVRYEQAGKSVGDMVNAIQRALGIWTELVSIEPLDTRALAVTEAPTARAKAATAAAEAGHGESLAQKASEGFAGALKAAKGVLLTVLVVGAIGLVLYAGITRAKLRG